MITGQGPDQATWARYSSASVSTSLALTAPPLCWICQTPLSGSLRQQGRRGLVHPCRIFTSRPRPEECNCDSSSGCATQPGNSPLSAMDSSAIDAAFRNHDAGQFGAGFRLILPSPGRRGIRLRGPGRLRRRSLHRPPSQDSAPASETRNRSAAPREYR